MNRFRPLAACKLLPLLLILGITACGGGGGGGGSGSPVPPPVVNASPGGIWTGTQAVPGEPTLEIIGLVAEDGRFHFIRDDGAQFYGRATTSGDQVSASYTGVLPIGFVFEDGSSGGSGSLNGTVRERQSITATFVFTTLAGTRAEGTLSLNYEPLYERDSSLATAAGSWTDALLTGSPVLTIDAAGAIFEQNPFTGCVVNGRLSIIDSRYNAYAIAIEYSNCTGEEAILNGSSFEGIATLDNTVTPEVAVAGLSGQVNGVLVAAVFFYERV